MSNRIDIEVKMTVYDYGVDTADLHVNMRKKIIEYFRNYCSHRGLSLAGELTMRYIVEDKDGPKEGSPSKYPLV
jgi:hypothetical protein